MLLGIRKGLAAQHGQVVAGLQAEDAEDRTHGKYSKTWGKTKALRKYGGVAMKRVTVVLA